MTDAHDHVFTTYIRTDPRSLWDALTLPESTAQWFHGLRVTSDWRVGSPISFTLAAEPQGRALAVGEILDVRERESVLFGFRLTGHDDPVTRVRWGIEAADSSGEVMRLTVTHVGFPERNTTWHQTAAGWPIALSSLKSMLETGRALRLQNELG